VLNSLNIRTGGAYPFADLILDGAGNLYGTTAQGSWDGNSSPCDILAGQGCGTVFKLDTTGKESVLYQFDNNVAPGALPYAGLVRDATGNLYGTTTYGCDSGAPQGWGTVFKLDPSGKLTNLHIFAGGSDGGCPMGRLVMDAAGNLYGTTAGNIYGAYHLYVASLVFKLTPNSDGTWTESVLHTFRGFDGTNPYAGLISDAAGNLYGTTFNGGGSTNCATGCGVVFKLTPNSDGTWKETVLHSFVDRPAAHPYAALVFDAAGNLYGTTVNGGSTDGGTVFKMAPV
jgi:uncharacterized repeat protein (TIGR03803 family)